MEVAVASRGRPCRERLASRLSLVRARRPDDGLARDATATRPDHGLVRDAPATLYRGHNSLSTPTSGSGRQRRLYQSDHFPEGLAQSRIVLSDFIEIATRIVLFPELFGQNS
jgi:hypothetical protein